VRSALRSAGEPVGVNVGGLCTGGLLVTHADPLGKHPEPAVVVEPVLTAWARFASTVIAATSSPYTRGR